MAERDLPRGIVPAGTYAGGRRSPVVYVRLCAPCAGYPPATDPGYRGAMSGRCQGCGAESRELHKFRALILSAANGGCFCGGHPQVTGDLPDEAEVAAVMLEVRTRPGRGTECPECGFGLPRHDKGCRAGEYARTAYAAPPEGNDG